METIPPDLAQALKQLALAAGRLPQGEAFLPAALDALAGIVPYDLAAVLRLEEDGLRVVCARGPLAGARVRAHRVALADFPSIGEALATTALGLIVAIPAVWIYNYYTAQQDLMATRIGNAASQMVDEFIRRESRG